MYNNSLGQLLYCGSFFHFCNEHKNTHTKKNKETQHNTQHTTYCFTLNHTAIKHRPAPFKVQVLPDLRALLLLVCCPFSFVVVVPTTVCSATLTFTRPWGTMGTSLWVTPILAAAILVFLSYTVESVPTYKWDAGQVRDMMLGRSLLACNVL